MKTLYLIRGLPGSGKSTLAALLKSIRHFEADRFFNNFGNIHGVGVGIIDNMKRRWEAML